ncbi:ribonuclease H-like domain-containing protein [Tanacetum coccineum]
MADQDTPPPTITAMKIPIIKKGEYDIWSMRMRQYICHTDHNLWDIIVNGDLEDEATPSGEQSSPPVPKTAKQLAARRNQERIKSILLLAIPDEYLLKFHNVPDAKSLWAAIKSRFGGNEESKKMQKNVLKHQFENFVTASNETLDKAYDRFQKLISQLEIHGAYVSKEDINQKFLRSLPPSWSQIALIMRNKPDIDEVDIDDLYNNLRVYEDELKRSSGSNSASQNLAFLSSENTNSTNEVSTASGDFGVSTAGGINQVPSTPTMDGDDLEELDLRWQVAMLTVKVKKFIQRTGRNMDFKEKRHVSLDKLKIECYNCHRKGHFAKECRSRRSQGRRPYGDRSNAQTTESSSQALVAQDGLGGYDWSNDFEVEPVNYALMAISSSNSSSSSDSEVVKERDELKLKIEKWEGSSKNLTKILNSQMSTHDKNGLGFGTQMDDLSNKSETDSENSLTIFEVRSSDEESTLANNRFTKANEYHAVPPPITGNPLTPRPDISFAGLDEYAFRNKIIESETTETNKTVGTTNEATIVKPKSVNETVVSKSKISRDQVIIKDWTSDDEDDVCTVKTVSSVKPNVTQAIRSQTNKSGQTSQKQGIDFKKVHKIKACFVCKSTGHLIKDYDFYDQKSPEPRVKNVVTTGERVVKPVWDYGKRVNHQNFSKNWKYPHAKRTFNPSTVLTRAGLVNTDRSNVSTTRSISTVRPVYTVRHGNPEILLQDHAVVNSGCSSHMTGNKAYLSDYEDLNGGFVAFGSNPKGGKITGKGTQDSYVAGSSGKDIGPTQEYILLPLQPHRTRIPAKDVVQDAQEQPSEYASPDKGIQVSEEVFKEGQHQMPENEQVWQDELEMMVTQEPT